MNLEYLVREIANAIVQIDSSRIPFRTFQPGAGPYGEPQLVKSISKYLNLLPELKGKVLTKRTPDLLIKDEWAIEIKIVRPSGDNGLDPNSATSIQDYLAIGPQGPKPGSLKKAFYAALKRHSSTSWPNYTRARANRCAVANRRNLG